MTTMMQCKTLLWCCLMLLRAVTLMRYCNCLSETTFETRIKKRDNRAAVVIGRRQWLTTTTCTLLLPEICHATDEMKQIDDPRGLFSIQIPNDFRAMVRQPMTTRFELPTDATTVLFTAVNMEKGGAISIECFPTRTLLEENGVDASGDLSTFPNIGDPLAIANLLVSHCVKKRPWMFDTFVDKNSIALSDDGKELGFIMTTEIKEKKKRGSIFRVTVAKARLNNNGDLVTVFASALEGDFNGPDGRLLRDSVDSFGIKSRENDDDDSTTDPQSIMRRIPMTTMKSVSSLMVFLLAMR